MDLLHVLHVLKKCEDILNTFQNIATILYKDDIVNDKNEIIEVQEGM